MTWGVEKVQKQQAWDKRAAKLMDRDTLEGGHDQDREVKFHDRSTCLLHDFW